MSGDCKPLLLSVACLLFTVSSSDASALPITALRSQLALQAWAVESGGAVEYQIDADPPPGSDPGYAFGFPPPQSGTLDSLNVDVYASRGQVSAGAKGNAEWSNASEGTVSYFDLHIGMSASVSSKALIAGCCAAPHGLSPIEYADSIGNGWAYEFTVNTPGTFIVDLLFVGDFGGFVVSVTDEQTAARPMSVAYSPLNPDGFTDTVSARLEAGRTYLAEIDPFLQVDAPAVALTESGNAHFHWRFVADSPTPLASPSSLALFLAALGGLGWYGRTRPSERSS